MMQQENSLSEATFAPPFDPHTDVRKIALAFIIAVGILGLTLSSKRPRSCSHDPPACFPSKVNVSTHQKKAISTSKSQGEIIIANTLNANTTSDQAIPATTNEEILSLLHQLVEGKSQTNDQNVQEQTETKTEAPSEITPEVKRLLEELLKEKSTPADIEANDDNVEDSEDVDRMGDEEDEEDDYTDSDLETVGYIAGGAALVGLGALLYHVIRKI